MSSLLSSDLPLCYDLATMYSPLTSLFMVLMGLALVVLFVVVELGAIEVAYQRLGISHRAISSLLLLTIFGSYINIPIAVVHSRPLIEDRVVSVFGVPYVVPHAVVSGHTQIAINVGGALIPALLSVFLLIRFGFMFKALLATGLVSLLVYRLSRLVPGVGIAVPTLVPGLMAAAVAFFLDRERAPALAYVAGSMGCLLGADIYNLGKISELGAPVASIGGAGTFDGVFVSGLIAVLLA